MNEYINTSTLQAIVNQNKIMNERFMMDCLEKLNIVTHPKSFELFRAVCDVVDKMDHKHRLSSSWEETVFETLKQFVPVPLK